MPTIMSLHIRLLGRPRIVSEAEEVYRFRSRKSWALLAVLLLSERRPTRSELASLLFGEADDPLRALRWGLAEIRRALGEDGSVEGDPVLVHLPPGSTIDVEVLTRGSWTDAARLESLGGDLLDGITIREAPGFSSWLLSEQRYVAAASEAILHEAALGSMSRGESTEAVRFAARAAAMNPLDETHQALLIRLYRQSGDDATAERQFAAYAALLDRELGAVPGLAIHAAMREQRVEHSDVLDHAAVEAIIEAGSAAVAAGAVEPGVQSLRTAVRVADRGDAAPLRVTSRLVLAEALIHSLRGFDEEGIATLHEADEIALSQGDHLKAARARSELGYVDFLRARYDRAVKWLTDALDIAGDSPGIVAKASTYLGSVESDRANYGRAVELLETGRKSSHAAGDRRREAYGLSMLGRVSLLRGDLDAAADQLDESIALAESEHWLALLPWPQALRGEVELVRGDVDRAEEILGQAFARACQLGDPCWEGTATRGLALVAEAHGNIERAFELVADARVRCNRLSDPYVWLDGYIMDAQCELGLRHAHPDTEQWVASMQELTSRTDMRELVVRSLLHGARLGEPGDARAAAMLAVEIDNPVLQRLVSGPPVEAYGVD